jgi:vacuolar-type H+-ATPase subunit H
MKEIIESVIQVEKESEARLTEARKQAGDIKKECDRELAEQTRIVKEKLTAAYQEKIGSAREKLEEEYRKKVESEKELYNRPVNLRDEPYNAIVENVVEIIAASPMPQRE